MKALALGLLLALPCYAGKNTTTLQPILAQPGKTILEQNFDTGGFDKLWSMPKGDWQVTEGMIVGKEKPEDKHAAVLSLGLPSHDSIIQFSLKLDGAAGFDLSYNHPKGHLFRIVITKDGLAIKKDGDKKDKSIKAAELATAAAKFEPGQWVTLLVEVKGDKVAVQADNGAKAEGRDPRLAMSKVNYRFVTRGTAVVIDDLKITEAK